MSRMTAGASLPFSSGSLRGVGLYAGDEPYEGGAPAIAGVPPLAGAPTPAGEPTLAGELARVVAPSGRIAVWGRVEDGVQGAVQEWKKALSSEGLDVLASEESAVVVKRTAS